MTAPDLEAQAKALYDGRDYKSTPTWDQLGDVTKSVWRERAAGLASPLAPTSPAPVSAAGQTFDLFGGA